MREGLDKVLTLLACGLAAIAVSLALGACGGGDESSTNSQPDGHRLIPHAMQRSLPAEIDQDPQGFASTRLMRPMNAWRTSSHTNFTEVDAGVLTEDESVGTLFIFRHEFTHARQHADLLKVIGSGTLRITRAPQGPKVEASAQRNGVISFVGSQGVRGTLHLSDDTITLAPRRAGG